MVSLESAAAKGKGGLVQKLVAAGAERERRCVGPFGVATKKVSWRTY